MADSYSAWSTKKWKPSGSSLYKQYRAHLVTSASSTNTAYSVSAQARFQINSKATIESKYVNVSLGATGNSTTTLGTGHVGTNFDAGTTDVTGITKTYTWTKTHAAQTVTVTSGAWCNKKDFSPGQWLYASQSFTIPAKPSYAVTYDANGGTGAPSSQTKWYNESLTLSSEIPTSTGYTFSGWNTAADGSGTSYAPEATYTSDAAMILYAQWVKSNPTIKIKINSSWEDSVPYVKVNGEWISVDEAFVKVNGSWETVT